MSVHEQLAEELVARKYGQEPEFWEPYGVVGRQRSLEDANYHFSYLAEALAAADPLLWADYIQWVKVLFQGLGFPERVLTTTLVCRMEVSREHLAPESFQTVAEYLEAAVGSLPEIPTAA